LVVSIDVQVDAEAAIDMLQNGLDNLVNGITQALDQGGADLVETAQSIVPVRTGYLRSTISYEVDGLNLIFQALARYAKFVEFGHHTRGKVKHMVAPRPFMRPAFYQLLPQIENAIAAAAANAFNG